MFGQPHTTRHGGAFRRRFKVSPGFGTFGPTVLSTQTVEEMLGLAPPASKARPSAPATPSDTIITASMQDVLRVVSRIAASGDTMPNNPMLGDLAGGRGRSSVLRALRRLARAKVVKIERRGSFRRVIIVKTGQSTDWGEARPGHSPYMNRRPGEPAPKRAAPVRGPGSRPMAPQITAFEAPAPVDAKQAQVRMLANDYADTCEWPLWADGEEPGRTARFCGDPSRRGFSFCPQHVQACFRPSARTVQEIPHQLDKSRFNQPGARRPNRGLILDTDMLVDRLGLK